MLQTRAPTRGQTVSVKLNKGVFLLVHHPMLCFTLARLPFYEELIQRLPVTQALPLSLIASTLVLC